MSFGIPNGTHREHEVARNTRPRTRPGSRALALAVLGLLAGLLASRRQRRSAIGVLLGPGVPLFVLAALRLTAREIPVRRW
jgi:hypothetical protein